MAGVGAWLATRYGHSRQDPLAEVRISPLTDFEGMEQAAAISRDGRFAAFVSDRDGTPDVWVSQIGTGEFHNLTRGRAPELVNPGVRTLGFSDDGSLVTIWTTSPGPAGHEADVDVQAVPTMGGPLRSYLEGVAEFDWSSDGRRLVYHTAGPGDPMFVTGPRDRVGRRVYVAPRGIHCHFPVWAPDDAHIYFVRGTPPDAMDIWRMRPDGSRLEQITFHEARVTHPVFLDERTLLYLATSDDGSGPWLFALTTDRPVSRRVGLGLQQYTSLAASADGRRLLATVTHLKASIWRAPILEGTTGEGSATRIPVPTIGGHSPRTGPGYLLYVTWTGDGDRIWKLADEAATELWSTPSERVIGGPSIAPGGRHVAFSAQGRDGTKLYVVGVDRKEVRVLAASLDIRGAPSWAPGGGSITVAAMHGRVPALYDVPLDGSPPRPILDVYSINPAWSPDGRFLVYADADVGPTFAVKAVSADGGPHALPDLALPRGTKRLVFLPGRNALVVLQGEMQRGDFWLVDLDTGSQRKLTDFGREFIVTDFDVSADGSEIIFDRRRDNSDIVLIDRSEP